MAHVVILSTDGVGSERESETNSFVSDDSNERCSVCRMGLRLRLVSLTLRPAQSPDLQAPLLSNRNRNRSHHAPPGNGLQAFMQPLPMRKSPTFRPSP